MLETTKEKINSKSFQRLFNNFNQDYKKISKVLDTNDNFLIELGKTLRNFELISWNIKELIIEINKGKFDNLLISKMGFRESVDSLKAICKLEKFNIKEIETLSKKLHDAGEIRNKIIHSIWLGGKNARFMIRRKRSKKISINNKESIYDEERFLLKDLKMVSNWFIKLCIILENLVRTYKKEI